MSIYNLDQNRPELDPECWIAPSATIIGKVRLAKDANIWFGAVLRGDVAFLTVGEGSNIQDLSLVHADEGYPSIIGKNCVVGHSAIIHGCTIEDGCLIGMGACVMNGAHIGAGSIVGAGALVTEGKRFPPNSLILGSPAKQVKILTPEQSADIIVQAGRYVENSKQYAAGLNQD